MKLLSYLAILLLALGFLGRPAFDPDLGWHLYGGQYILRNLAEVFYQGSWNGWYNILPQADPINFLNRYWHDYHWLAQVIFASLYQQGGISLLMLFLPVTAFWTLLILYRSLNNNLPSGYGIIIWLLILAFSSLLYQVSSVRPQMLSILLISAAAAVLLDRNKNCQILKLFVITVMIANFHVYWIFVPLLYFCQEVMLTRPFVAERRKIYIFLFLCTAGIFTPYSLGAQEFSLFNLLINYALLYDYLFIPEVLRNLVGEFKGAYSVFNALTVLTFAFYFLIIFLSFIRKIKYTYGELLLLLLSLLLPVISIKYLPLQVIFLLPVIVRFVNNLQAKPLNLRIEYLLTLFILCYSATKVLPAIANWQESNRQILDHQPITACATIARVAVRQPTKIATFFDHGGWCRLAAGQVAWSKKILVSTDGRTQGVSNQRYRESLELFAAREGWQNTINKWHPDFILVPRYLKLFNVLAAKAEEYPAIYSDANFVVFLNKKLYPGF